MLLRLHYRWPDRRRAGGAYPLLGGADFRAGVADLLLSAHGAYGMGGWLPASLGALDFAGGTVVHISAASAANEIVGLAFINTVMATAGAILS